MSDATAADDLGSRCPSCARTLRPDVRFCPGCGRAAPGGPVSTATAPAGGTRDGPSRDEVTTDLPWTSGDPVPTGTMTPVALSSVTTRHGSSGAPVAANGSGRSGTSSCTGCGATNAVDRILCGACGLDLATGDPRLSVRPSPAADRQGPGAPVADDGQTHAIHWRGPALAGVVVLVAVAAAIVGLGLGPFAPATDLPPAVFDAASYPGEPGPLTLTDIATLTLQPPAGTRTFTPDHLVDGDPTTAWHGDQDALPNGTDEKVDLFLGRPAWITAVVIDNGDHLDADAYASTSRVQRAILVFDGDVRVPVTLLDQGLAPQIVELEDPLLSAAVRLEIIDTVAGTELQEVALTRLELLGFPAEGDDVAVAEERAALLPAAGAIVLPS